MNFMTNIGWWKENGITVALAAGIFIQWIALQALMIHYHLFRKNLKRPRPDGIRLSMAEKTLALQSEQMERIFGKLAHLNREIDQLHERGSSATRAKTTSSQISTNTSVETAFASMGELNMKKRIQEMRARN